MLHIKAVETEIKQDVVSEDKVIQIDDLLDRILNSSISYSLSVKFLLLKQQRKASSRRISSFKEFQIGPVLYLQEHYPVLMKIFQNFPEIEVSESLYSETNSGSLLKIFAEEIERIVERREDASTLPSVTKSIRNLAHLRTIYTAKEVQEVTQIISSGLVISQLKNSFSNTGIEKAIKTLINIQESEKECLMHSSSYSSEPKSLEDIISGFGDFENSLERIKQSDQVYSQLFQTWNCMNEFEQSIDTSSEFMKDLHARFYEVFIREFEVLIQNLSNQDYVIQNPICSKSVI